MDISSIYNDIEYNEKNIDNFNPFELSHNISVIITNMNKFMLQKFSFNLTKVEKNFFVNAYNELLSALELSEKCIFAEENEKILYKDIKSNLENALFYLEG